MKRTLHKIMAFFMAAVVLMATMSFTVDMHYCGNTLIDFSFIHKVETCGMEKTQILSSSCENPSLSEKPCCTDKQIVKEGEDDLKLTFDQLSFEQQQFVASFTYTYINLFEGKTPKAIPFKDYAPPFIRQDIQVLHQTYLI